MILNIQEEKFYFNNDLTEYTVSKEGQAVKEAFKTNNMQEIDKALYNYYKARKNKNFTYNSEQEKLEAINTDKMLAEYYRSID